MRSPLVWRAFRPFVQAFGEGDAQRSVRYLRAVNELLAKMDGPLERDEATRNFQTAALASISDFDLRGFYQLLPQHDGDARAFSYRGAPLARGYDSRLGTGDFEVSASSKRRGFGDSSGVIWMRHPRVQDRYRYLMRVRAGVGLGELSWPAIAQGALDELRLLEERADVRSLPLLLQTADAHLRKSQPALGPEDRHVLASFWSSFPESARMLDALGGCSDVLRSALVDGATAVHLVTRWDVNRMAREYPALASFLKRFGKLAQGQLTLVDARGRQLARVRFETERMQSELEAFVRDGRLLASERGVPLAEPPDYSQLRMHIDVHIQQYGLHMHIDDLKVELTPEQHETGASLAVQMKQTPSFRASGAAFGVFPAGMLDWFVPGDIEGLARRMLDITMKGNDGQGVTMALRFERASAQLATLDGAAGFEILDTALIRFGMRIAAERVMPDADAQEELARATRAYRDALRADLERFATYGQL